jgi:hypothetical protein
VRKLRGSSTPEARVVIETAPGTSSNRMMERQRLVDTRASQIVGIRHYQVKGSQTPRAFFNGDVPALAGLATLPTSFIHQSYLSTEPCRCSIPRCQNRLRWTRCQVHDGTCRHFHRLPYSPRRAEAGSIPTARNVAGAAAIAAANPTRRTTETTAIGSQERTS